jgi:hypothetical protein
VTPGVDLLDDCLPLFVVGSSLESGARQEHEQAGRYEDSRNIAFGSGAKRSGAKDSGTSDASPGDAAAEAVVV